MTDSDFISYCETHSETPRALFSVEHVKRILALAGKPPAPELEEEGLDLITVHDDIMHPLCAEARSRLDD